MQFIIGEDKAKWQKAVDEYLQSTIEGIESLDEMQDMHWNTGAIAAWPLSLLPTSGQLHGAEHWGSEEEYAQASPPKKTKMRALRVADGAVFVAAGWPMGLPLR
jgi:hypothetical protein